MQKAAYTPTFLGQVNKGRIILHVFVYLSAK